MNIRTTLVCSLAFATLVASGFGQEIEMSSGERLLLAVSGGKTGVARDLIESGADVSYQSAARMDFIGGINRSYNGMKTPLMMAVQKQDVELAELLIARGAPTDSRDQWGLTILDHAARVKNVELVRLLVEYGAPVNCESPDPDAARDFYGPGTGSLGFWFGSWSALHWAARSRDPETIRFLVENGADVNRRTDDGKTVLHRLLAPEAIPFVDSDFYMHQPARIQAPVSPRPAGPRIVESVNIVVATEIDLSASDYEQHSALYYARSRFTEPGIADLLLEQGATLTFEDAVQLDDVVLVRDFLDDSPDLLNVQYGRLNDSILHRAARTGAAGSIKVLVDAGLPTDILNNWQQTPLLVAVENRQVRSLTALLDLGADCDLKGYSEGRLLAPFELALQHWNIECIQEFLRLREAVSDDAYLGALNHAARSRRMDDQKQEILWTLIRAQANANFANDVGANLLVVSCRLRDHELVRELIRRGADVNGLARDAYRPLQTAIEQGEIELVRLMLDAGADVDAVGFGGLRPLHVAVWRARRDVIDLLLGYGATINAPDANGRTPLTCLKWSHPLVNELRDLGATR